ncbi:MAG: CoA-binding protein [Candidatus Aenigmarchaeota archaeon]|nr:CoA-binding protein [Candidatus Aenigmarchaeota archaeon]
MLFFDKFFNPESVAVVGASRTPGKIGYTILENLKSSFNGEIYPINPNAVKILGLNTYPSVLDVEEPIDHAVIVVPAEIVLNVIKEGIKKRIKAFTIISSGFSEIGEKERELKLKELSKKEKIRIIGPNCIGIYKKNLDMIFFPKKRLKRPPDGFISFITQSGAFGSILLDIMAHEGVGVSKFISIGNKVDVDEIELIKYLGKDLSTRCIAIYLESVRDGQEFIKTAKKITKTKPIVAFKAGKTERGMEAVASHTGALAGSAQIYSAAFKQAGIIEAKSSEEIFDYAKALANLPVLKNNKIAIVTDGGGFGIVATDAAIKYGLELPRLGNSSLKALKSFLPSYASTKNPIDITGDATDERYQKTLEVVLKDKNISGVVCIALMQIPTLSDNIVNVLKDCKFFGKPITVCSAGSQYVLERNKKLERFGIPVYPTPERAVKALTILHEYGKISKRK